MARPPRTTNDPATEQLAVPSASGRGFQIWVTTPTANPRGAVLRLARGAAVVGSDPGCDLVLDDPSVSREHARFEVTAR